MSRSGTVRELAHRCQWGLSTLGRHSPTSQKESPNSGRRMIGCDDELPVTEALGTLPEPPSFPLVPSHAGGLFP